MESYLNLRRKHIDYIHNLIPDHQARLTWSREQIQEERNKRLLEIVENAKINSAWHRERLSNLHAGEITENELGELPIMTKEDLMHNWDEIVTDKRLTLESANRFINEVLESHKPMYFLGRYLIYASGGSSGTRGVYVWDWEGFATFANGFFRYQARDGKHDFVDGRPLMSAVITEQEPVHMSTPLFSVPMLPAMKVMHCPATTPLRTLVETLNKVNPTHLIGYTSAIHKLAQEAQLGRLKIKPKRISVNSEPLFPEMREDMTEAWGTPINNMWGSTDCGPHAVGCDYSKGMHLSEDLLIIEPMDENNHPVSVGKKSDKILITSLFNKTLPLIRYEMTDQVTVVDTACPCGSKYRLIEDVRGRADDEFIYKNGVSIHPIIFRSPLGQNSNIEEYQVVQTGNGADISIIALGDVNIDKFKSIIVEGLKKQGLSDPEVTISIVDKLQRQNETGKLKRFIPLKK